jgi:lambda family phage tail tape measure protein
MSDVIGRGVIEVTADSTKLKAGIDDSKRSIKGLGTAATAASTKASQSIDRYVKKLEQQNATFGKSVREAELYKLSLRGASEAQLKAADSALKLAEANAKAEAKSAAFQGHLKAGAIAAAAAVTLAAGSLGHLIMGSIDAADNMNDLSKKTGISVEQLSGLALAAQQSGSDLESIADSINKLSVNIGKDGEKFRKLGITAKEPLEAFKQLADVFVAVDDPQTRAALGAAALGKSWQGAAPLLAEGGKNIGEMVEKGMRLSSMSQDLADNADAFNDSLAEMKAASAGLGARIATDLLPGLNSVIKAMSEAYKEGGLLNALWIGMGGIAVELTKPTDVERIKQLEGSIAHIKDTIANPSAFGKLSDWVGGKQTEHNIETLKKYEAELATLREKTKPKPAAEETPEEKERKAKAAAAAAAKAAKFIADSDAKNAKKAEELAKAKLDLDVTNIKKTSDVTVNALAASEKILEARRSAGLIEDQDYYAAKLGFLNLNSAAQEDALQQEIARYKAEDATGKRKLENDKKIAEAQAALAKVRTDTTTSAILNNEQEEAANRKVAQSYVDATKAAQSYIETIKKQDARDIAGYGKGNKFRQDQAARGQMSDSRDVKVEGLQTDLRNNRITQAQFDGYLSIVNDTYAKELAAYDARTAALNQKQGDWMNGAQEAFSNYRANAEDVAGQSAAAFSSAFEGMTDGVASSISRSIVYGENFGESMKSVALSVADAFIASFIKIQIQKLFIDKTSATLYASTIAAQSQAMVAMAGLNAFAATAAIPIVGPVAAPASAAAAIAAAEIFATTATAAAALSVASAAGGFDIPAGINPLTQLHEREMVLPAQHADTIRRLGKAAGSGGGDAGAMKVSIVNNTTGRIDRVQQRQISPDEIALVVSESVSAVTAQMGDPNSKVSRGMHRNFSLQRTRG